MEIVSGYLLSVSYINLSIALTILLLLQLFRGLTNKANILNSFLLSRVLILRFLFMAYGCLRWLRRATAFPPRCHYERFYGAAYVKIDRYSYIHIYICMYLQFHDLQVDIRFSFLRNKFAEFRFACLVSANFTNLSRSLYAKAVFHSVFWTRVHKQLRQRINQSFVRLEQRISPVCFNLTVQ